MNNSNSLVRTEELEFSYNSGRYSALEAIGVFAEEVGKTGVAVEVVSTERRDAGGFPTIRLHGPRAAVVATLRDGWDAGFTPDEMSDFIGMMLGDSLSRHRWETGCNVGRVICYSDHNEDIRTKGSCDYCGGTSITFGSK
jgi:hypothetical protein